MGSPPELAFVPKSHCGGQDARRGRRDAHPTRDPLRGAEYYPTALEASADYTPRRSTTAGTSAFPSATWERVDARSEFAIIRAGATLLSLRRPSLSHTPMPTSPWSLTFRQ